MASPRHFRPASKTGNTGAQVRCFATGGWPMNVFVIAFVVVPIAICASDRTSCAQQTSIAQRHFGDLDGKPVSLYTLQNRHGIRAEISDYGGVVTKLITPDRDGNFDDVVLGHDVFDRFIADNGYLGAIVGRYANRIAEAKFSLEGKEYQLATNAGPNSLHGGNVGFNKRIWHAQPSINNGLPQLKLSYLSPDGEEGFPGNLEASVTYSLTDDNGLKIEYYATTDQPTVCNLSHHGYFNLAGQNSATILDHHLQLFCDAITPNRKNSIPTGQLMPVKGTPFDFLTAHRIGQRIDDDHPQIQSANGYDHNFVINGQAGQVRRAAWVRDPLFGRTMEVWTTDVGIQFYTANFLSADKIGKSGKAFGPRMAFCLECQRFPNSPNQPQFPSATLRPGETYEKTTIYKFGASEN